jgi:6-phosphogluconolactonase (cycloisomerase 2 family)
LRSFPKALITLVALLCLLYGGFSVTPTLAHGAAGPTVAPEILYVSNQNRSVTAYALPGSAVWSPRNISTLSLLTLAYGLAVDAQGRLYVASTDLSAINVYPGNASGEALPAASVRGSATGVNAPTGLALGPDGSIFVANLGADNVTIYSPAFGLNGLPVGRFGGPDLRVHHPAGIAVGRDATVAIADYDDNAITMYRKNATGEWHLVRALSGPATQLLNPSALVFDARGNLFVANANGNSVTIYGPGSNGNSQPVRALAGLKTQLRNPTGIALDDTGRIYVANYAANSITVYSAEAGGNAAPLHTLSGASLGLHGPLSLTISHAVRTSRAPDLGLAPGLLLFSQLPSGMVNPDGTFTQVEGMPTVPTVPTQKSTVAIEAVIAKATPSQASGIMVGNVLQDGYLLESDGQGACLIGKYVAGKRVQAWLAKPIAGVDTHFHAFRLTIDFNDGKAKIAGSIDGMTIGPVVDTSPPVLPSKSAVTLFTGGTAGTVRSFKVSLGTNRK